MLSAENLAKLDNYKGTLQFENPNILKDFIRQFQQMLEFSFALEEMTEDERPELQIGKDIKDDENTSVSQTLKNKVSIMLSKREFCGENSASKEDLFTGNLISGSLKFRKSLEEAPHVKKAMFRSDNEFNIVLKTKTVKAQLELLNILEKSLNIHSRTILADFIDVCGIRSVDVEGDLDKDKMYTANILFQARLKESALVDDSYLLEAFKIAVGENLEYSSGKEVSNSYDTIGSTTFSNLLISEE